MEHLWFRLLPDYRFIKTIKNSKSRFTFYNFLV